MLIVLFDQLAVGPCHEDPRVHEVLRRRYWERPQGFESAREDERRLVRWCQERLRKSVLGAGELIRRLSAFPERHPIVVWSTPAWSDQLQLWWTLDALERGGIDPRRILIPDVRSPHEDYGLGSCTPEQCWEALPRARPLSRESLLEGARLWHLFAAESPQGFDAARRRGSRRFPHLARAAGNWVRLFPRKGRGGHVRLSELDTALLGRLRVGRWTKATPLVCDVMLNTPFGRLADVSIFHRFLDWASYRPYSPAVEARFHPEKAGLGRFSFRLTPEGRRILSRGLRPVEAPPFPVGGAQAYGCDPTWVVAGREAKRRIERLPSPPCNAPPRCPS